jgi:hypothetical protein
VPAPSARVCRACGLGVLLETRSDAVPVKGDAFVIADSALQIQAMSASAERLLAMDEGLAVNRAIGDLLVHADVEVARTTSFADLVVAALSGEPPIKTNVRPWNTFGVRLHARIARCGPPPAALIVLD